MEIQGLASSRAAAATGTGGKRRRKGATGGGGAAPAAPEAGTSLEDFGSRRQGGATIIRIEADDLGDVFDPVGFKSEWTPGEVERVEERSLPPKQCPLTMPRTIISSAARRARVARSRVLPPLERQPARWRVVRG